MDSLFFSIIQHALGLSKETLPKLLSEHEAKALFSTAEKQAVLGLLIDVLFTHNIRMSQENVFDGVSILEQIKQGNEKVNNGVKELHTIMTKAGVPYEIVKGQAVASYYPKPFLRQSGDIDFYCKNHFENGVLALKDAWNVEPERHGSGKHADFTYNGNIFEIHFQLTDLYSKKRNDYFRGIVEQGSRKEICIDSSPIYTLSPSNHVLFVFLHLCYHLLSLGVGLRQFCDMAVMLHGAKEQIDMSVLRMHLYALGLDRFWCACGSILVDYLGLPEEELGFILSHKDRNYGRIIMNVVMSRGNMGHYETSHGELLIVHGYHKESKMAESKRKLQVVGIKLSHFVKFAPLAPSYACGWLWHEIKRSF